MIYVIIDFIHILTTVLFFAILIRALMSWFMPQGSALTRVLDDVTDPVLRPIRRVLPPVSGIDFSPILAMVLLNIGGQVLISLLNSAA
jgi:YggT family protein